MKRKTILYILVILIIIVIIAMCFLIVDVNRLNNNNEPIFSIQTKVYEDGGSTEYIGLGYKIINYVKLESPPLETKVRVGTYFMKYDNPFYNYNNAENGINTFIGTVIQKNTTNVLVVPNKDEEIINNSDKILVNIKEDKINSLDIGTIVEVRYTNDIKETYPAVVDAEDVILLYKDKVALMYMAIIDDLMSRDEALNSNAKYISLDVDSFLKKSNEKDKLEQIDESTKLVLLEYAKKYNSNVKDCSFVELKEQGLYNEEFHSIEGVLIYLNSSSNKINENDATISAAKYRSGLGAIFPKYNLEYDNNNNRWNLEVVSMAIS